MFDQSIVIMLLQNIQSQISLTVTKFSYNQIYIFVVVVVVAVENNQNKAVETRTHSWNKNHQNVLQTTLKKLTLGLGVPKKRRISTPNRDIAFMQRRTSLVSTKKNLRLTRCKSEVIYYSFCIKLFSTLFSKLYGTGYLI